MDSILFCSVLAATGCPNFAPVYHNQYLYMANSLLETWYCREESDLQGSGLEPATFGVTASSTKSSVKGEYPPGNKSNYMYRESILSLLCNIIVTLTCVQRPALPVTSLSTVVQTLLHKRSNLESQCWFTFHHYTSPTIWLFPQFKGPLYHLHY